MSKHWLVTYGGAYLGGKAVVIAETSQDAISLVAADKETSGFRDVRVEEIPVSATGTVLYNDDGDY